VKIPITSGGIVSEAAIDKKIKLLKDLGFYFVFFIAETLYMMEL